MNLQEMTKSMSKLDNWSLERDTITKDFEFTGFKEALDFVNKVGEISEAEEHHPDILLNYNRVKLILVTHDAGGLTEKDFELAEKIDRLTREEKAESEDECDECEIEEKEDAEEKLEEERVEQSRVENVSGRDID